MPIKNLLIFFCSYLIFYVGIAQDCPVNSGFIISANVVCLNNSISIENTSSNADYYKWYLNNSLISYDTNINLYFSNPGEYIIKLIAENDTCTDEYIDTIQCVNSEVWDAKDIFLCQGDTYEIILDSLNTSIYTFEGTRFNGIVVGQNASDTLFQLVAVNNSCNLKDTFELKISSGPDVVINYSQNKTLYTFSGCCGSSYNWSGASFYDSTSQYPITNLYSDSWIYMETIDSNGCKSTDSVFIDVNIYIPNIITPNNDGINDLFEVQGIYQPHLNIFNRWGTQVYESTEYHNDWFGENVPGGIYYYSIKNDDIKTLTGWIQIIK